MILNVYGPYRDRESFWDRALRGGLLGLQNLILGGDLNLTLNSSEIWGKKASPDPLTHLFSTLFDSLGLMDIAPLCSGPTWRNGRAGDEGISKRIDRFMVSSTLIPLLGIHRAWTHCSDISDHLPIVLEWNKSRTSFNYPFKFNRSWLEDTDFIKWFHS